MQVDLGKELTPRQVKDQPEVRWDADDKDYYALVMTGKSARDLDNHQRIRFSDPDAPSRQNPEFREAQHWIVVNIPGNNVSKGEVLTEYIGSGAPQGTGWLVWDTTESVKFRGRIRLDKSFVPVCFG